MAIAESTAKFTVQLDDKVSAESANASKALEDLRKSIVGDKKALADMNRAFKDMNSGSAVNVRAAQELRKNMDLKKQAIAEASGKMVELGGSLSLTRKKFVENKAVTKDAKESLAAVAPVVDNVKKKFTENAEATKMSSSMMAKMGIGALSLTTVFVALAAAIVAGTVALAAFAMKTANARRDESIQLEGLSKIRDWYGRAATGAAEMQANMDQVSASTALGRGQIMSYNEQLYRMGLRGQNLKLALEGVSKVASVQGDKEAGLFMSMAAGAAFAGQSVKQLADDVEARIGDTARKKMLSFDVQMMKLGENLQAIFHGLNLGKFLSALNSVVQLFGQGEEVGKAWKQIMEVLFQPLFDGLGTGAPLMKRFIQGITIAILSMIVVVLTAKNWLWETFGVAKWTSGIDKGALAIWAGYAAVGALVVGFTLLAASIAATALAMSVFMGTLLMGFAVAVSPVVILVAAIYAVGVAIGYIWDKFKLLLGYIGGEQWANAAQNIIDGIVNGIKNGAGLVWQAMKELGSGAIDAFKGQLGIRSPSRVFAEAGLNITQGVQQGVEQGAPGANAAVSNMMTIPSGVKGGSSPGSATGSTFNITVNASGGDAASIAQAVQDAVTRALEGMATSMGAGMEAANV